MLRIAILSARGRPGTFAGALVALFAASVLAMAWGMQLEAVLRAAPPVERYAGAAAVVTGQQEVGADRDVLLSERARVSSGSRGPAGERSRRARGDRRRVGARRGRASPPAVAHGWSSAALTPYVLSAGRAPARPGEVVTGYPRSARRTVGPGRERTRPYGHRRRRGPPAASRHPSGVGLSHRRRGHPAGRASRSRRHDRSSSRDPGSTLSRARRRRQRFRAWRGRGDGFAGALRAGRCGARGGRVPRAPAGAHHADPGQRRPSADWRCSSPCSWSRARWASRSSSASARSLSCARSPPPRARSGA